MLYQYGIVKNRNGKAYKIFKEHIEPILPDLNGSPSEYVSRCWDAYQKVAKDANNNGTIFEYIIETLMIRENLMPFYCQAQVNFVPNVIFDVLLYTSEKKPITLSLKTSMRERYKQADLEAMALKNVHRKAENYLLTLNATEAATVNHKIQAEEVFGLKEIIVADTVQFDNFIENLKKYKFVPAASEPVVTKAVQVSKQ